MPTIAAIRLSGADELRQARVDAPVLTADLLLAFVLGYDRVRILIRPEEQVPEQSLAEFRKLISRRAQGEPLQYLTGTKEFYGLSFRVTPDVLIPRPETELMVEKAVELIRNGSAPGSTYVDVGTGSGCIAVSLAHEVARARGFAVDISAGALGIARGNALRHGVAERIEMIRSDLLGCFLPNPSFDLILCNPPYIALKDCGSLPRDVRDYEPHRALFGGESGLEVYERLLPEAVPRLYPEGYVLLELGMGQAAAVTSLVNKAGLELVTIVDDLQGIPRCLVGRRPSGVEHG